MPGYPRSSLRLAPLLAVLLAVSARAVYAHGGHHHDEAVDAPANQVLAIDTILWLHIYAETLTWGLLFPVGMVLGLSRSRFHVPLQVTSTVVSCGGMLLAQHHAGRQFNHAAHGNFAPWLFWIMVIQAGLGIFLKMHIMEGSTMRWLAVTFHGLLGRLYPVIGYIQMVLGVILGLGFCTGGHLGQCLAHFILGSSFVGYGILILIMSMHGAPWLAKHNISQEFMDSTVIMTFGIVITFTMHGFIEPAVGGWTHKDLQHTAMGVLFWTGGALGMWLGRNRKRNIWPALVVSLTGFAMSGHEQETMLSTNVHAIFGYTLMLAGICRIVEICFVMKETHEPAHAARNTSGEMYAFQHLCPFLLVVGGLEFMSATEEQLGLMITKGVDHVTYIVAMFCMAFVVYLWSNLLIALYHNSGRNAPSSSSDTAHMSSSNQPSLWRSIWAGATSHLGSESPAPKSAEYQSLANGHYEDGGSIELGTTPQSGRLGPSRSGPNGHAVFDAAESHDDGTDSYWEQAPPELSYETWQVGR